MKLWYELKENGRIANWTTIQHDTFEMIEIDNVDEIKETTGVMDGQLVDIPLTESELFVLQECEVHKQLMQLRSTREAQCFAVINRGYLWYSELTTQQIEELQSWYRAWLDVTQTMAVPAKLEWLN